MELKNEKQKNYVPTFEGFINESLNVSPTNIYKYMTIIKDRIRSRSFDVTEIDEFTAVYFDTGLTLLVNPELTSIVGYNTDSGNEFVDIPSRVTGFKELEKNIKLLRGMKGRPKPVQAFSRVEGVEFEDTWEDGTWENGIWYDGTWLDGTWEKGRWDRGTWQDGTWKFGTWQGGRWNDGTWYDGTWDRGTWQDGTWKNGGWYDGIWEYGTWETGDWIKGTWQDGTWNGGTWYGGTWYGGTWDRGTWKDGTWKSDEHHPNER